METNELLELQDDTIRLIISTDDPRLELPPSLKKDGCFEIRLFQDGIISYDSSSSSRMLFTAS